MNHFHSQRHKKASNTSHPRCKFYFAA